MACLAVSLASCIRALPWCGLWPNNWRAKPEPRASPGNNAAANVGASHRRTPDGKPLKTAIDTLEPFYEGQHDRCVVGVFRGFSTLLDVLFSVSLCLCASVVLSCYRVTHHTRKPRRHRNTEIHRNCSSGIARSNRACVNDKGELNNETST